MRSRIPAAVLLAVLAGIALPRLVQAQIQSGGPPSGATLDADYTSVTVDDYARAAASGLSSALWGTSGRASALGVANVARFGSGTVTGYGDLRGSLGLSTNAQNISTLSVEGGAGAYRGRATSNFVESSLLLGAASRSDHHAAWLEAGAGRVADGSAQSTAHIKAGGSVRSASATASLQLGAYASGQQHYADAVFDVQWTPVKAQSGQEPRLVVGGNAGVRGSEDVRGRHGWLMGMVALRVIGAASIVVYAGAQPPDPERGTPGAAFSTLALRLSVATSRAARSPPPIPRSRETIVGEATGDGTRLISVADSTAKTMELMADFTSWVSVPMLRSVSGLWQARVRLSQGSHRIQVRADSGKWVPPAGLPAADDDFGGKVGILVVQ